MIRSKDKVAIIGIGRLGTALARALYQNQYLIVGLIDQHLSHAKRISNVVKAEICSDHIFDLEDVDIIFICVPDDAIDSVVASLKNEFERRRISKFVFHCSGALTSNVFDLLTKFDIACASVHPIQTFAGQDTDWQKLSNIYWGLEGDLKAIDKASEIIEKLKSHTIIINREFKSLYHLACTMASNYLVSLLVPVVDIFKKMNFSEQQTLTIIHPLLSTTISNLKEQGLQGALTGPISRGDIATIIKHIETLTRNLPHFESMYKLHGKNLLNLPAMRERISIEQYEAIKKLLDDQGLKND